MKSFDFLTRNEEGKIVVSCYSMEVYVPKSYFDEEIAELVGDKIQTIGILLVRVFKTENSQPKIYRINFAGNIAFSFSSERKEHAEFIKGDADTYNVYSLEEGDIFLDSETIVPSSNNLKNFVKLLHSGKLPKTTYESIYKQYMNIQESNNIMLKVSSATLEAMIAELTRWKDDKLVPFRMAIDNPKVTESDYQMVSLKTLPFLISTFSGLSFEDIDKAILYGIERKKSNKKNIITPMEETIKY
jgi:uncharacterized protein YifE (UPF0438 family)